jgi:hypothetical protein
MRRAFSKRLTRITSALAAILHASLILFFGLALRAQQAGAAKGPNAAAQQLQVKENVAPHPAPEQPLPFSHKTHVSRGMQCRVCHTNPEPGNQMTFPAVTTCMGCHKTIAADRPAIQKLAGFAQSGQAIPWVRVYEVTKGVTWTHRKHLSAGGAAVRELPWASGRDGADVDGDGGDDDGQLHRVSPIAQCPEHVSDVPCLAGGAIARKSARPREKHGLQNDSRWAPLAVPISVFREGPIMLLILLA